MIKTILTVDDSRTMRDMLRLSLEGAGFRVVQAEDGVHGLEVLAGEMPDVIVTDINMPQNGRVSDLSRRCAGTIRGVRPRFWC